MLQVVPSDRTIDRAQHSERTRVRTVVQAEASSRHGEPRARSPTKPSAFAGRGDSCRARARPSGHAFHQLALREAVAAYHSSSAAANLWACARRPCCKASHAHRAASDAQMSARMANGARDNVWRLRDFHSSSPAATSRNFPMRAQCARNTLPA
jgi:hypothetical protein